jgi:tRNA threonylcarbamoyladenosine biosynthesis protein TsaB
VLAARVPPPAVLAGEGGCDVGAPHAILAAIDARMGEIYTGTFVRQGDGLQATSDETVIAPAAYRLPGDAVGWIGVGTGFAAAEGALATSLQARFARIDAHALPHAADLAHLAVDAWHRGEAIAPERVEPAYLRNNVALTLEEQKALRDAR